METLVPLPIPSGALERRRLHFRQWNRGQLPGAHLVRRKGQSLEFRELRPHIPGEDIRYVDWRASRRARPGELLARTFELDAQARIVISIDARESMRLPAGGSKLQAALWLAEAVAFIASRSGDRVAIHTLFDASASTALWDSGGPASRSRIRAALRRFAPPLPRDARLCLRPLDSALPPAAIWLILTDLYCDAADLQALARRVRQAQNGLRWVIVADFDSWNRERALLGEGLRRVEGPGPRRPDPRLNVTAPAIRAVEARIADWKGRFEKTARAGGYDRMLWEWPVDDTAFPEFFRERFFADPVLPRIFMKDA